MVKPSLEIMKPWFHHGFIILSFLSKMFLNYHHLTWTSLWLGRV
jgi:hypothetical protein